MKLCICKNFGVASAIEAIQNGAQTPEEVHGKIHGNPPGCGQCLPQIEAMAERFRISGEAVPPVRLTREERRAAAQRLIERAMTEHPDGRIPVYFAPVFCNTQRPG